MVSRLFILRVLASLEMQRQLIVNGTRDEYLLPDELLDDAASFVDLVESKKIGRDLTAEQIAAVLEFGTILRQNAGKINNCSNEFLIEQDKCWQAIRLAAQRCFVSLTCEDVQ